MKKALVPLLVALAAAAAQVAVYYERLPDPLASHFDGSGRPNGWMAKTSFVAFYFGLLAFLGLVLGGSYVLTSRAPDGLINLPNKDYWLAPERREESLRFMRGVLYSIYCGTMGFMVLLTQSVFSANLGGEGGRLGSGATWLIVGFLVWILALTGRLIVHFARVPSATRSQDSQT